MDTFGLFDRSPEEAERDERHALLMELRQFRQQHPEQFRRIKGLPLRVRVGRADASLPFVNEEERHLIRAAQAAIRRARFQNLQGQVNQLYRSTKEVKLTPAALADKLIQILRTYPLETASAEAKAAPVQLRPLDTAPEIILSESFDELPLP